MIVITDLVYCYPDGTPALRGINLQIARGEKVALLGVNGAGKSTLLLHLNGTLRPTGGSVTIDGIPITAQTIRAIRARVGLVFQDPDDQLFSPTVSDDVAFGPRYMGLSDADIERRVQRALAVTGMSGHEHRAPHRLSLGQRKRVALATVLAMEPDALALDEPSAGLDPRARRELAALLRSLPQTMVIASHDLAFIAEVCPRVVVLSSGSVTADEPTAALLSDQARLIEYGLA